MRHPLCPFYEVREAFNRVLGSNFGVCNLRRPSGGPPASRCGGAAATCLPGVLRLRSTRLSPPVAGGGTLAGVSRQKKNRPFLHISLYALTTVFLSIAVFLQRRRVKLVVKWWECGNVFSTALALLSRPHCWKPSTLLLIVGHSCNFVYPQAMSTS